MPSMPKELALIPSILVKLKLRTIKKKEVSQSNPSLKLLLSFAHSSEKYNKYRKLVLENGTITVGNLTKGGACTFEKP